MKIKLPTILLVAGGIIFFANQIFAADSVTNTVGQTNEPSPLQIFIIPNKTGVHVNEPFAVSVEIKNVSSTNQQFTMWSCSWSDNWKLDNSIIRLGSQICTENWPMDINLASRKSYKGELKIGLLVFQSVPTNKISFRLGFTQNRWSDREMWDIVRTNRQSLPDHPQHELGKNTYWSNEVSVDLIPN